LARGLGFELPLKGRLAHPNNQAHGSILVHTGAGQPVRVWPLERYRRVIQRLREKAWDVQVACDADQRSWWLEAGEKAISTPASVTELLTLIDKASVFIGNDSGPGHLAAFCGTPTFTIFGPQLPEWFAPLHPASEWSEGKACPYKPCSDYCQFPTPYCMVNSSFEEVIARVESFLTRAAPGQSRSATSPLVCV
jgi:heptosyltransferase-2